MRVLIVRLRQIGDVVFTTPAVRALREHHPGAHIAYLVEPAAAPVVHGNPNIDDVRPAFFHQGVLFMEYRGASSQLNQDGTTTARKFIPANTARFFPLGTIQSAVSFAAPGDFIECLNMPGYLYYAKAAPVRFDRGVDLHTQSSFLPLWTRPKTLVKGSTAAS